jgi:hypothetical protein
VLATDFDANGNLLGLNNMGMRDVFAAFTEHVGAKEQSAALLFCLIA